MNKLKNELLYYIIGFTILFSCSSSNDKGNLSTGINNQNTVNIIEEINSYKPLLKKFFVLNQLMTDKDSLSKGLELFLRDITKKNSFNEYKDISISDIECKQFKEKKLYEELWVIDTSAMEIGSIEGERIRLIYDYSPYLNLDSEYYQWLKANKDTFPPNLEYVVFIRENSPSFDSFILVQNLSKKENIDYSDENLITILIVEVLLHFIDCN
jgi:hypothetical protein